ncbi:GMC oxidoreductase [Agrobacterium sp. LAD9]|uniref:GMC oxidoreductase n=1 Tax=Agrobacterium sp. LAD9 TaxID=2055153 RepID=UPI000D1EFC52|nr:GMC family oxidoreductase [Agrobacterium sp. LAD9]
MSEEAHQRLWDVVVVGTGIGGATAGYALAKAGFSVLFCEKGIRHETQSDTLRGNWAESFFFADKERRPLVGYLERAGRRSDPIVKLSEHGEVATPMLGQGSGGSSSLYGMVCERFFPIDFEPIEFASLAPNSTAPQRWPISFKQLAPYYSQAERLYRVRSGQDELRPAGEERVVMAPPPFGTANTELVAHFKSRGLHPYHLPMACEYVPGCKECIGFLCNRACKGDSAKMCLAPAIEDHGATILDACTVEKIETEGTTVSSILCRRGTQKICIRAKIVILAAGALETPALLLRSTSEQWPEGLANRSGQVGRNLMRHFLDYYIVKMSKPIAEGQLLKQIGFNDLYDSKDCKLGTVQSNGRLPPVQLLARTYLSDLAGRYPMLSVFGQLLERPIEHYLTRLLSRSMVFASILEDYPYAENRVGITAAGAIAVHYEVQAEDQKRLQIFRRKILELMKPYKVVPVFSGEKLRSLGHACGTCRFGNDPATNVLDANNRAHGLNNLYVVDASFLPTSSGTNPSLTIAANALRVAEQLILRREPASPAIHAA